MIRHFICGFAAVGALLTSAPARAELTLCNRTSIRWTPAIGWRSAP